MSAIRVEHIEKSFAGTRALSDIGLEIEKGELFGLIGPDGAGKTTLFRILTTLLVPDAGDAWVAGFHTVRDFRKIRRIVGYMPGRFSLYPDLSVEENLRFFATIFGTTIEQNYALIEDIYVQLAPFKDRRAAALSGGMKQKLALCCALIHEPEVLFLDEPTTGVDAVSRVEFWEMLARLKAKGITILVSTPYMDEAALCERIALIQSGRILKTDTPENIRKAYPFPLFSVRANGVYRLLNDLRAFPRVRRAEAFGDTVHLAVSEAVSVAAIRDFLSQK
ncbi:MAG: ABC transporter ATP-binding protein, partial [Bacteroidetes bacterium]